MSSLPLGRVATSFLTRGPLLGALIVGIFLRSWQLPDQMLFGDEWTSLGAAFEHGPVWALQTFGEANISSPLVLYYHLALATVGINDWVIRMPSLLLGVVMIALFPALVRPVTDRPTAHLYGWFLALSPILVLFSRYARPYIPAVFLGITALAALYHWWRRDSRPAALWYVFATALSVWLLPINLPFLLTPLLYITIASRGRDTLRVFLVGLLTGLSILALLLPALLSDPAGLVGKAGQVEVGPVVALEMLAALLGGGKAWLSLGVGALAAIGVMSSLRSRDPSAWFLLLPVLAQLFIVLALQPAGGYNPIVLARYSLLCAPVLLLWAARGSGEIVKAFPRRHYLTARWVPVSICLAMLLAGPVLPILLPHNQWVHRMLQLEIAGRPEAFPDHRAAVPEIYRFLAEYPTGTLLVAEASAPSPARFQDTVAVYQQVHRQHLVVAFRNGLCKKAFPWAELPWGDDRIRLRNYGYLADLPALESRGVVLLIFAKRLRQQRSRQFFAQDWGACEEAMRRRYGAPILDDIDSMVFATPAWWSVGPPPSSNTLAAPTGRNVDGDPVDPGMRRPGDPK